MSFPISLRARIVRESLLALFALAAFVSDQVSKWWVIEVFFRPRTFEASAPSLGFWEWLAALPQDPFPTVRFEVTSFFNLVMVWNTGVSFGMFSGPGGAGPYILMAGALILCFGFLIWMWKTPQTGKALAMAAIIGGAFGNVLDRLRFGGVADFLDFHIFGVHWPAFNIADSCIVLGVAALALYGLVLEPRAHRQASLKPNLESAP
jgi:signal peptidase II